jgi:hypothetical protein
MSKWPRTCALASSLPVRHGDVMLVIIPPVRGAIFPLFLLTQLTLVILFYTKIKKFPHPLKKIEYFFPITTHSIVTIYYKSRIVAMEPVFVFTTGNQCRELHIAFQPQGWNCPCNCKKFNPVNRAEFNTVVESAPLWGRAVLNGGRLP